MTAQLGSDSDDHDCLIRLVVDVGYMRRDVGELKSLLETQNSRVRKLEERWWLAMGGMLVASAMLNWLLTQAAPLVAQAAMR